MKKITEKELNRPDNKYVDRIEGEQWKIPYKYNIKHGQDIQHMLQKAYQAIFDEQVEILLC